ncbi:GntR family transcriptional regulator [uncultured Cohaesibacter sp.]|uniref:GntR family transcriptional regulator n=1 Tax=uncultured Cohaesibacter sp. TaxID=1002546 RepID=UPI0029C96E26|nr:GntR family transcriptional regulator [uncultured Cohaesibacter sp.]
MVEKSRRNVASSRDALSKTELAPLKRLQPASERVSSQLRQMIVSGQIALGEQLSENALAERLGVSRTPVREAFKRLESEELVEVRPQRGTFVFICDEEKAREMCEMRSILEIGAMQLAVAHDRAQLVKKLNDLIKAAEASLTKSPQAYQPFDIAFHAAIFELAQNRDLDKAYERISGRVSALRWRLVRTLEQVQDSHNVHIQIVDHLAAGRDEEAANLMRIHVDRTYLTVRAMFEENSDIVSIREIAGRAW